MNSCIVIIPVYKPHPSVNEAASLRQCVSILHSHPICLVCPEGLNSSDYENIAEGCVKIKRYSNEFFKGIEGYNSMMLSNWFYCDFQQYEYMLIYQLDAWVFSDQLTTWCSKGYDYVGAPWFYRHKTHEDGERLWLVGNGGFSLRKIAKFIEVTASGNLHFSLRHALSREFHRFGGRKLYIKNQYRKNQGCTVEDFPNLFYKSWEDLIFCIGFRGSERQLNVPTPEEAALFSMETSPSYLFDEVTHRTLPFGCHAWRKNQYDTFWSKYISEPSVERTPDITVVTVCYNIVQEGRKEMFLQCLESVQEQEDVCLEHLIIDGASTDGTLKLAKDFVASNHTIRIVSEKDSGIYDAMNKGISKAKGEFVIFLNTDDFFNNPQGLRLSLQKLRSHPDCAFSFAPVSITGGSSQGNPHVSPLNHIDYIFQHSVFSHQSMLTRRDVMMEMGGFDLSYKSAADYDFILRLILNGYKGLYVGQAFVNYRMVGVSSTNLDQSTHETALVFLRLYNKYAEAHLTEEEAYHLHITGIVPANDKKLLHRLKDKTKDTFVGVTRMRWYSYRREWRFITKCLRTRNLLLMRNFFAILLCTRFNTRWYMNTYKDSIPQDIPAAEHYMTLGWREGKEPSGLFSTNNYLAMNPDVAAMDICPLLHWMLRGRKEKRRWK